MATWKKHTKRLKKTKSRNAEEALARLKGFLDRDFKEPVRILCGFWEDQQNAISYQELRAAVVARSLNEETFRLWSQDYSVLVVKHLKPLWEEAMRAGSMSQPVVQGLSFDFNMHTPGIMNWIKERGAAFVTESSEEQRNAIQALLAKKMVEGHTVDELAKFIRPCIGLTKPQAEANLRYYENVVKTLKEDHPRMKRETVERKAREAAAKYAERQHRQRALTIARTESAYAYNRGADEGIRQAQAHGLLGKMEKRWSTSGDDGVCDMCAALEGTEIGMDESFDIKGKELFKGHHMLPPAHPNCACAVEYIELEPPAFSDIQADGNLMDVQEEANDRFGIFTNNQPSVPGYYDFKGKDMEQVEKEIAERQYETAVCFGKNGKAKFAQIGDEDSVRFTMIQLLMMKGADITHNHPNSTPPSPEDLYLMKDYKANSFRTTGKDGTYVLRYTQEVENLPDFKEFSDAYERLKDEYTDIFFELTEKGIGEKEALRVLGENIWEGLFQLYGVKPVFERR